MKSPSRFVFNSQNLGVGFSPYTNHYAPFACGSHLYRSRKSCVSGLTQSFSYFFISHFLQLFLAVRIRRE